MKQLWSLFIFILPLVLIGQNSSSIDFQNIDYEDIKEIKGLLYMKVDTSLVTGRVVRSNKKREVKRYILVENGVPNKLGWVYNNDNNKKPKKSSLGSIVSTAAFVTGAAMSISGNDVNLPIRPYNGRDLLQTNEIDIFLDENKEIASKAYSDMAERNDISKKLSLDKTTGISTSEEYYKNGQLAISESHIDGKKNGVWEKYYPNGNLEVKGNYIDGVKDGLWEEYYENSQLMSRLNFILGKKEGLYKEYHSNGQLRSIGNYKNGLVIGEWKFYNENGKLLLTENYEN